MAAELATTLTIWNSDGWRYEICKDNEGFGLVELRHFEDSEKLSSVLIFNDDEIPLLIEALQHFNKETK